MNRQFCNTKRYLLALTATVTLLLSLTAVASASTVVDPSRFIFTVKPGERTTGTIKVTNPGKTVAQVYAVNYDWTLNAEDKLVTTSAGTRKDSLKGCIKFNPQNFKLAPGASQIVRFTLTAPVGGGYLERRGIVFFEERLRHDPKQPGANILTQVGSTIYLGLEGMKMGFNVEKITVAKAKAKSQQVMLSVANSGEGHIRYRISYKIVNEKGSLVKQEKLSEQVILPQFKRRISFDLPDLEPGKYNLLCGIEFLGTEKIYSRTIPFTVDK
jgi:P pilus assembly chaperone PapD